MSLFNDKFISSANANMAGKSFTRTFFYESVKFKLNFKKYFNRQTNIIIGNINLGWIVDSNGWIVDISNLGLTVGHPNGT